MFVCRKSCCSSPTKVHEPDAHKKHWKQPGHSRCQKRGLENSSKSVFIQSRERLPLEVSSNLMGGSVAEGGGESHLSQHSALFNNGVSVRQQLCVHQLTCRQLQGCLALPCHCWMETRKVGRTSREAPRKKGPPPLSASPKQGVYKEPRKCQGGAGCCCVHLVLLSPWLPSSEP